MCERTSATSESSITLTETLGLLSIQTGKRTFRYASSAAGLGRFATDDLIVSSSRSGTLNQALADPKETVNPYVIWSKNCRQS